MISVAQEKQARSFHAAALFAGRSELFADHVHLSEQGSRKMAEVSAQYLADVLEEKSGVKHP